MRLFIGISISEEARSALAKTVDRVRKTTGGRYVEKDMYHITLAFLGEVDNGRMEDIKSAMEETSAKTKPSLLALSALGIFGDGAVLYAGMKGAEGLHNVASDLRHALAARGLPYDPKPFKAHITLARRVNATKELLNTKIEPIGFMADRLTLFHSCRVDGVLRYLPIHVSYFGKEIQ